MEIEVNPMDLREQRRSERRGFSVPPDKRSEYRYLVRTAHYPAAEAARILGLLP